MYQVLSKSLTSDVVRVALGNTQRQTRNNYFFFFLHYLILYFSVNLYKASAFPYLTLLTLLITNYIFTFIHLCERQEE